MNNFDKNKIIIQTLSNSNQFADLQIVGTNLLFRDVTIDLNKIDLETIIRDIDEKLTPDNLFKALENTKEEKSSETTTKEEIKESINSESAVKSNISDSNKAANNTTENVLSDDEEFSLIVSQGNFSVEDIGKINNFLENTKKMINNHTPNIETRLKNIEGAVTTLQLMKDCLNSVEEMVVAECNALLESYNKSMGSDKGQVLTYNNPNLHKTGEEDGNFGYLNIVSIFITISAVLIGLSIFLLHILS